MKTTILALASTLATASVLAARGAMAQNMVVTSWGGN